MKLGKFATATLLAASTLTAAQQAQQQQPGQAQGAAPNQPKPKSQGEVEALQKVQSATDPDARMQAIENVLTKYADTEYKPVLLQMAMQTAQQKGDPAQTAVYAERVLQADPKNFFAQLTIASETARSTREFDLDKEQKLQKVDQYAKGALESVKTAEKPNPQIPDAEWEAAKKDYEAQAHDAMGLAAFLRKKNDVAITEFKTATEVASKPSPATMLHLANAYVADKKYDDAIALCDKAAALPESTPQAKQVAEQIKQQATKMKSGGGAPAASPAPKGQAPQGQSPAPGQTPPPAGAPKQ